MERILVIQTAFLGDAILTLPLIQKLTELNPSAAIDVLAIPSTREIFENSPSVSNVLAYDKRGKQKGLFGLHLLGKTIRKNKYSKIYSPHRSARTSLLILLSRCKQTFGFNISTFSWAYKTVIKYQSDIHEVQRNFSLLGSQIPVEDWKVLPEINRIPHVGILNKIQNVIEGERTIAIAPGSVWETKKYPITSLVGVTTSLMNDGWKIIILGSKEDLKLCEKLNLSPNDKTFNLAGKLSIVESVELLRVCKLIISNDSAPTHMGVAANIPVITVFCSTIPEFGFYPYNEKSISLSYNDLSCKPCGIHGHKACPIETFDCGKLLLPDSILKAIKQITS